MTEYNLSHCDLPPNLIIPRLVCMLFTKAESTGYWMGNCGMSNCYSELTYLTFLKKKLFIWLHWVLVAACGVYLPDAGSNQATYTGSSES